MSHSVPAIKTTEALRSTIKVLQVEVRKHEALLVKTGPLSNPWSLISIDNAI